MFLTFCLEWLQHSGICNWDPNKFDTRFPAPSLNVEYKISDIVHTLRLKMNAEFSI